MNDIKKPGGHHQQVELIETSDYKSLLSQLNFEGLTAIEVGTGRGVLTRLLLERNPKRVIGYEIDPGLTRELTDPRLDLRIEDITKADLSELSFVENLALVSNPPYKILEWIKLNLIDQLRLKRVILMTSPKLYKQLFPDYEVCFELDGEAFIPVTPGKKHLVIKNPNWTH